VHFRPPFTLNAQTVLHDKFWRCSQPKLYQRRSFSELPLEENCERLEATEDIVMCFSKDCI
jgi:hypothetical protein